MANQMTALDAKPREADGSREARRLRREGLVPGVVYGGGGEPLAFQIGERELRSALSGHSALYELKLDGDKPQPVLIREYQRHPVSGAITHIDLIRVSLKEKVQAAVNVEVTGAEDSPGIRFGGLLEQTLREVNVSALPMEIPESLTLDASSLEIGDALHVSDIVAPDGVEILDDPESLVATIAASRMAQQVERDLEEAEAELIGEEGEEAAEEAGEEAGGEAQAESGEGDSG